MNNKQTIIDGIEKSNLADEVKTELISVLKKGNRTNFIIAFLRAMGISIHLIELFDLDIGDLIDIFL
jgi:HKD family nuclease